MTLFHHNTRATATRTLRRLLLAAALAVAATPWVSAFAQAPAATYPNKPVRIIVGFPAGPRPALLPRPPPPPPP